jgi:hypothetical protein
MGRRAAGSGLLLVLHRSQPNPGFLGRLPVSQIVRSVHSKTRAQSAARSWDFGGNLWLLESTNQNVGARRRKHPSWGRRSAALPSPLKSEVK